MTLASCFTADLAINLLSVPPFSLLRFLSVLPPLHFIFHHCFCYCLHCICNFLAFLVSSPPLISLLSSFLCCPVSFVSVKIDGDGSPPSYDMHFAGGANCGSLLDKGMFHTVTSHLWIVRLLDLLQYGGQDTPCTCVCVCLKLIYVCMKYLHVSVNEEFTCKTR